MMAFRKGFRRRRASRPEPPERMREATRRARQDARAVGERERREARERRAGRRARRLQAMRDRRRRAAEGMARLRRPASAAAAIGGAALVALGPLARAVWALLRPPLAAIAPYVSAALLAVVSVLGGSIALGLDAFLAASRKLRGTAGPAAAGVSELIGRWVTPVRTVAAVGILAAGALAASQFADYAGVAVGEEGYRGEIGSVAPVPITGLEDTGSAHLYAMLPLAALAVGLVIATARGRWKLGRAVALVGLVGIAVSLAIDMPKGLDAGGAETAYEGADAQLLGGFWVQLFSSAALVAIGPLLGRYVRLGGDGQGRRRSRSRRKGRSVQDAERRTRRRIGSGRMEARA